MEIQLFPYNQTAYQSVVEMLEICGKAAVIHPTGTGKSFIGFKLCEENADRTVCWLSPSEYIYETQLENLRRTGAQVPQNICFYTYARLMRMEDADFAAIHPDYIILDEFHRCGAKMWGMGVQKLLETYPQAKILGLSATSIRYLDAQRDMSAELFEGNVASQMTLGEAIVRGILKSPKYVLSVYSYQKNLKRYKKRIEESKNKAVRDKAMQYYEALRRAMEQADGLAEIFQKYIKDRNAKYIIFCANVEHMQNMMDKVQDWFGAIDSKPHVYSAYSDDPTADRSFAEFKEDQSTHLKLLFCIDMLNEGIHVDEVDGVILFRTTVSPIVYKQQIGRALSVGKTREPVIFDIVNNIENLYGIGTIEQEMQAAVSYYHFCGREKEIVQERFHIIDEVCDARHVFEQLEETLSASWDMMYDFAREYFQKYGNLEVSRRYKTEDGYSLGNWIYTQRKVYKGEAYGVLGPERIRRLEEIGMVWGSVRDISWRRYLQSAKQYFAEYKDLNVPCGYKTEEGLELAAWISRIRFYRKNDVQKAYLTPERIAELDKLGMIWSVPDHLWEENYAAAKIFYQEHGHLNVPTGYCSADGLKIGTWIRRQRDLRAGKIDKGIPPSEEQIARLDAIGMNWKYQSQQLWEKWYRAAEHYQERYGNLDVPTTYVSPEGERLGKWLAECRRKGRNKYTPLQQKQLDALGMVWEKPNSWEVRYALAKEYYEKNGKKTIPTDYRPNGIWLAKWVNEQKQICNGNRGEKTLTEDQLERLQAIGVEVFG